MNLVCPPGHEGDPVGLSFLSKVLGNVLEERLLDCVCSITALLRYNPPYNPHMQSIQFRGLYIFRVVQPTFATIDFRTFSSFLKEMVSSAVTL